MAPFRLQASQKKVLPLGVGFGEFPIENDGHDHEYRGQSDEFSRQGPADQPEKSSYATDLPSSDNRIRGNW